MPDDVKTHVDFQLPHEIGPVLRLPVRNPLPPRATGTVYHYTSDAASLIGMICNDEIWASESQFMNDGSERQTGIDMMRSTWNEIKPDIDPQFHFAHEEQLNFCETWAMGRETFIACASLVKDSPHQLGAYGRIVVALDTDTPLASFSDTLDPIEIMVRCTMTDPFTWRPVIYDPVEQRSLVKRYFEMVTDDMEEHGHDNDNPPRPNELCSQVHAWWYTNLIYLMKHQYFYFEQEVRQVAIASRTGGGVRFRDGKYGVTPYVPLKAKPVDRGTPDYTRFPVSAVGHQAFQHPETMDLGIRSLLRQNGYEEVDVYMVDSPAR